MRILVTGGSGQLGKCLQDWLGLHSKIDNDLSFRVLSRSEMDITDVAAVKQEIANYHPNVVINAAAYTAVDQAELEPDLAWRVNTDGPGILAKACAEYDALMVHVSTDYVFDGCAIEPYLSSAQTNPLGVYGETKLAGERQVQALCTRHIIVRTAWVFSEYGNNFMKTMLRLGSESNHLNVVADQYGTPTYGGDLAEALGNIAILGTNNIRSGVYHFCGGEVTNWHGFAENIFNEAHRMKIVQKIPLVKAIKTEQFPTPVKRPAYSVLSGEKLLAEFGVAKGNWHSGIQHALNNLNACRKE